MNNPNVFHALKIWMIFRMMGECSLDDMCVSIISCYILLVLCTRCSTFTKECRAHVARCKLLQHEWGQCAFDTFGDIHDLRCSTFTTIKGWRQLSLTETQKQNRFSKWRTTSFCTNAKENHNAMHWSAFRKHMQHYPERKHIPVQSATPSSIRHRSFSILTASQNS